MKKNKGFTIIELLVVVLIIGLLASIVLVVLSGVRERTQKTAFKEEVNSYKNKGSLDCTGATAAITAPVDTINTDWGAFADNCSNGDGTFSITATALKVSGCTATVTDSSISYTVSCN